jgi:hypothetical protein
MINVLRLAYMQTPKRLGQYFNIKVRITAVKDVNYKFLPLPILALEM